VAIKVMPAHADPSARQRFLREVRILGRVRHPSLVQVYGSGEEGGNLYYAMEWVEGATLRDVWQRLGEGPARVGLRALEQALRPACGPLPPTNLAALARRPWLPRAVELLRQVAGAAGALHQAGVVHRNLTPGNVMLTADGRWAVVVGLGALKEGVCEGGLTR